MNDADMVVSNRLPDTATSDNGSRQGSSKDDLGKGGKEPFQLHHVHDSLSKVCAACRVLRTPLSCLLRMLSGYVCNDRE